MSNQKNYIVRMLSDDSGEPSPKLHAGAIGVFIIFGFGIAHVAGVEFQEFVWSGLLIFTASCFGISEIGRFRK